MWLFLLQCFIEERLCPEDPYSNNPLSSGPLKGFTTPVQLPLWALLKMLAHRALILYVRKSDFA